MSTTIDRLHAGPRMSKIVRHAGVAHLCGQTSVGTAIADAEGQTREVLARVDALLAEAGSDRSRLLAATVPLRDISDSAPPSQCECNLAFRNPGEAKPCAVSRAAWRTRDRSPAGHSGRGHPPACLPAREWAGCALQAWLVESPFAPVARTVTGSIVRRGRP